MSILYFALGGAVLAAIFERPKKLKTYRKRNVHIFE